MLKKVTKIKLSFYTILVLLTVLSSCKKQNKEVGYNIESKIEHETEPKKTKVKLTPEFKAYWYAGEAEISSYKLQQARYGEMRVGYAVLVYVTEEFLPENQVKADYRSSENIPVLKLNATKNFLTGIYPYSIMQSTFYPIANNYHALKVSASVQEWCGHVYTQLNNKDQFEITSHSYFGNEGDQNFTLKKSILENELWVQIRINPKSLPVGDLEIIPAFEYTRLRHIDIKPYKALASLNNNTYSISYPELNRTISIQFNPKFPYDIFEWSETSTSSFGDNSEMMTTKATLLKTIKSPYWQKNHNEDEKLRETLLLN